jgi:hypothetical protein
VQEVVSQYSDEESRFGEAVKRSEDAFERGGYLTCEQVGQHLERFLMQVRWSRTNYGVYANGFECDNPEAACRHYL